MSEMNSENVYNKSVLAYSDINFKNSSGQSILDNNTTSFARAACILLFRVGFMLIQIGSIPVENVYIIVFHNVLEIAISIFSFGFIGYIMSFADNSVSGLFSYGSFIGFDNYGLSYAILGICACLIATAVMSSLLITRMNHFALLGIELIFCSLCEPLILHWTLHEQGWMNKHILFKNRVSVKDQGGSLFTFIPGSTVGLLGAIFLGRSVMKMEDIDNLSMESESVGGTISGYIFVVIGFLGFFLPTPMYDTYHALNNYTEIIIINCIMAMSAGILVVTLLQVLVYRKVFDYWIVIKCTQGAIVGLVAVAAGVDLYSPVISFTIAVIVAIIYFFAEIFFTATAIVDPCKIIPLYFVCGMFGVIAPSLFTKKENLQSLVHLFWQFICWITVVSFITICFGILFLIFWFTETLRNDYEEENHTRAIVIQEILHRRGFWERLFKIDRDTEQIRPGNKVDYKAQITPSTKMVTTQT